MEIEAVKLRRIRWRLFLAAWLAYAFFHQGGGWSQNSRFAMVRSIVEEGSLAIDDFMFYASVDRSSGRPKLVRMDVDEATFTLNGRTNAMAWPGERTPINGEAVGAPLRDMGLYIATGDLAYAGGRFYPNHAPGTALAAVPGYFLLHGIERLAGLDPDDWWILTLNAWLTSAFSIGLISALGVVAFHSAALALWGERLGAATWATAAFAFGTIYFPYATMLHEHDVVAACLLAGFALLARPLLSGQAPSRGRLPLAGLVLGWAAISSYIAVVPVAMLTGWLLYRSRRAGDVFWLAVGLAVPAGVVLAYHSSAFGTPFTTSYAFPSPRSAAQGLFLGTFSQPTFNRFVGVLVSPFRGLFFSSPVLLAGVAGIVVLGLRRGRRAEGWLIAGIAGYFLLYGISFDGWHGGWSVGPRHLIPALPFLALGMTWGFDRWFRSTAVLALLSLLAMLAFTAVDPQSPVGISSIVARPGRPTLLREPLTEYAVPLFVQGKARWSLDRHYAAAVEGKEQELIDQGIEESERAERIEKYEEGLADLLEQGDLRIPVSLIRGPVSAHPIGAYEIWFGHLLLPPASEHSWNAFNAGELLIPQSRLSLLFLLLIAGPLVNSALSAAAPVREALAADGI